MRCHSVPCIFGIILEYILSIKKKKKRVIPPVAPSTPAQDPALAQTRKYGKKRPPQGPSTALGTPAWIGFLS